jgi:Xaa-Pro dipeptidase
MREEGLDLLVLSQPEHYNWLSGYDPTSVFYYQALFVDQDDDHEPILLCNKAEMALCKETCWLDDVRVVWTHEDQVERTMEIVRELGFADRTAKIGLNLNSYHLRPVFALGLIEALPQAEVVNVGTAMDDLRLPKSEAEVDYLRRAAHIADLGVTAGINAIRAGVMDREVMAEIQHAISLNGGEFPAYPTLVDARGTLHGTPIGKILAEGDAIYLEVTGVVRRYHCNISRTVMVGEPSKKVRQLYDVVKDSLDQATDALRPGRRVGEIVELVADLHKDYQENTWGRFGFSMEISYPPIWIGGLSLMRGDDHVLEPGMVITMEPGLSYADGVTMMLGNNVLVTENDPEILNNVPADLFVK